MTVEPVSGPSRRRATSSLISDHSDGLPYYSRENSSASKHSSDEVFVEMDSPPPDSRNTANPNPGAPIASMRAQFTIGSHRTQSAAENSPFRSQATKSPAKSQLGKSISTKTVLNADYDAASHDPTSMEDVRESSINHDFAEVIEATEEADRNENGADKFYSTYKNLLVAHQEQTTFFERLHTEHAKSMKRVTNLASRRKQRIEYVVAYSSFISNLFPSLPLILHFEPTPK